MWNYGLLLVVLLSFISMPGASANTVTLTFDDIPAGQDLVYYRQAYGVGFYSAFSSVSHAGAAWGAPHSGTNVLVCDGPIYSGNEVYAVFKHSAPLPASSVGGYFSTELGTRIQIIGSSGGTQLASAWIGADGESWDNAWIQIASAGGITALTFREYSPDGLRHFCVDDLTIDFIPEPSSLLALLAGLASVGAVCVRRRRR